MVSLFQPSKRKVQPNIDFYDGSKSSVAYKPVAIQFSFQPTIFDTGQVKSRDCQP